MDPPVSGIYTAWIQLHSRLLGIPQNDDIGTINETVANIFGQEIGTMVYNRYYSQYQDALAEPERQVRRSSFRF